MATENYLFSSTPSSLSDDAQVRAGRIEGMSVKAFMIRRTNLESFGWKLSSSDTMIVSQYRTDRQQQLLFHHIKWEEKGNFERHLNSHAKRYEFEPTMEQVKGIYHHIQQ